jgi:hypothetical protein
MDIPGDLPGNELHHPDVPQPPDPFLQLLLVRGRKRLRQGQFSCGHQFGQALQPVACA